MAIRSKVNLLREIALLYRKIRWRRGYGVHSPFVYNLITKVIEERCPYYAYEEIGAARKKLLRSETLVPWSTKKNGKIKYRPVCELVSKKEIGTKEGNLLFRLTNYFKPSTILQVGTYTGISSLCLSSYSSGVECVALEPDYNHIYLGDDHYDIRLRSSLRDLKRPDFIFFNVLEERADLFRLFTLCVKYRNENTVIVCRGIRANKKMRELWRNVQVSEIVTVTIDLYSMGIIFFNKKLHKHNYIVNF